MKLLCLKSTLLSFVILTLFNCASMSRDYDNPQYGNLNRNYSGNRNYGYGGYGQPSYGQNSSRGNGQAIHLPHFGGFGHHHHHGGGFGHHGGHHGGSGHHR